MRNVRVTLGVLIAALVMLAAATRGESQTRSDSGTSGSSSRRDTQNATQSPSSKASKSAAKSNSVKINKLAIQVDENKPEVMNLVLNNAKNVLEHYKARGEKVVIEIVAYGPGLHMLREDTSPVKQRVAEMSLAEPDLAFIACGNTQTNQSKQEEKPVVLISEAKVVPSGVVRLMELQGQGYAYIRP